MRIASAPRCWRRAPRFRPPSPTNFTEAVGDLYTSSLIALGVLLFLITFVVISAARLMLQRMDRKALGSV